MNKCLFCGQDGKSRSVLVGSTEHGGTICENCAAQAGYTAMQKMIEMIDILEKMLAETKKQVFSEYWGTDL